MNNVVHMKALNAQKQETIKGSTYVAPEHLHSVLDPCNTQLISFRSEKSLKSYRAMLYTINRQGEYRYRTIRAETEMWGLLIWRMK